MRPHVGFIADRPEAKQLGGGTRPVPRKTAASRRLHQHRLGFDVRTVVTGRAFIALESPVGAVDRISDIHFATPNFGCKADTCFKNSLRHLSRFDRASSTISSARPLRTALSI